MTSTNSFTCAIGIIILCGCASSPPISLPAVGPPPSTRASNAPQGTLIVYSAFDSGSALQMAYVRYHSGYKLYSSGAGQPKYIRNTVGITEDPEKVPLSPGNYTIVACSPGLRFVTVPVVIEQGKVTSVYLDGTKPQDLASASPSTLVSLPNGMPVGWRAKDNLP